MKVFVALDTMESQNLGCQLVSHQLRNFINNSSQITSSYYSSTFAEGGLNRYLHKHDVEELIESDIVYVNGEGSCSALEMPRRIRHIFKLAWEYHKPVYFCNFTFDPRWQFKKIVSKEDVDFWLDNLSKCKVVTVRDPISYQYLKRHELKNLFLYPDLGTSYQPPIERSPKNIVMLGGGSIIKKIIPAKEIYIQKFQEIIDHYSPRYEFVVPDWPSNPESDGEFLKDLTNVKHVSPTYSEYYNLCSQSVLNITGRHHGAVMSFAAGCPFLVYQSNMWKMEGDNLFYGTNPLLDIFRIDTEFDKWIAVIDSVLDNLDQVHDEVKKRQKNILPFAEGHIRVLTKETSNMNMDISFIDFNTIDSYIDANTQTISKTTILNKWSASL